MRSHRLKVTLTKNRKGAVVAIAGRNHNESTYKEFALSIGGVVKEDDLREAVLHLLGAAVDPCVDALKAELATEAERIAALREKERNNTRRHRAKKAKYLTAEGAKP